ncbi:hypothetical protein BCR33DRAFT_712590 [Rhizoclosmatium globosum]|uniref:Uncharacterized protein n=1 Tax=Rhizoclosmatium globosum TaxID=329046 RepID=A0A1Y2CWZ7_9FUNG|nr:hypothetical protein BCR33DRAFT_712590 [Rhizoclosmatium globosum]|eukprot:ORY51558.1 hypothetical protein BCR33DRAFT_712590 [Rhizoclosmatium globosum]
MKASNVLFLLSAMLLGVNAKKLIDTSPPIPGSPMPPNAVPLNIVAVAGQSP